MSRKIRFNVCHLVIEKIADLSNEITEISKVLIY
jgi:hypothetical protein